MDRGRYSDRASQASSSRSTSANHDQTPSTGSHAASSPSMGAFVPDEDDQDVLLAIQALQVMRSGSSNGSTPHLFPNGSATATGGSNTPATAGKAFPSFGTAPGQPPSRSASITSSNASVSVFNSNAESSTAASSSPTPASSIAAESDAGDGPVETNDPNLLSRVSQLPIVSGGLDWYERSKASSRVVKYGAGLVESGISTISRPITNQFDRFSSDSPSAAASASRSKGGFTAEEAIARKKAANAFPPDSKMASPTSTGSPSSSAGAQVAVAGGRSRWQTVLVEAGGLGAAVSEESLKSLRYCLQWLLYATAHLDHQISTLREFIVSLQQHRSQSRSDALVHASASAHLSQIKHDVVEIIRKVVDVMSKYAGAALPEQARRYVRQSIMGLPVKWATAIEGRSRSRASSVASSVGTPVVERMEANGLPTESSSSAANSNGPANGDATTPTEDAAERVLTFAVESLDMLRTVAQIFGESVEKAEAWIERLRIVGLDRQRRTRQAIESTDEPVVHGDSGKEAHAGTKRRRPTVGNEDEVMSTAVDGSGLEVRRRKGARSREASASLS